jgi:integrative and conjugative element protein (TIGR02256 family)
VTRQSRAIVLQETAYDLITAVTCESLPLENGGILIGYHEGPNIVVTHALAVTTPTATTNRYVRDDVHANALLREFLAARDPDDPAGYVGEWHSHPAPFGPSSIDLNAIRATAKATAAPVALIVHSPDKTPPFAGIIAKRQRLGRVATDKVTMAIPDHQRIELGPLPEGAVRGDGPVFISYRQSDGTPRADSLEGLLRAAGLVVWRDRSDLRAGTTTDRLEQALTAGLSAAVLIVTPEIAKSTVVKNRELPRLLQLDEDRRFSLSIANEIPDPRDATAPNYAAPDCLLVLAPAHTLGDKKQSNSRTPGGRLEIVRDILMHRVEQLKPGIDAAGGIFTITSQTRPEPFALDAGQSDLHIRIKPAPEGKLPSRAGLQNLQQTLPLTSDAVRASGASTVHISGGMHLSVAFAIGAALPETKIGHVQVTDLRGAVWKSKIEDDPNLHTITTDSVDGEYTTESDGHAKFAAFVTLTENADDSGFRRLISDRPGQFASAARISLSPKNPIDAREAGRLSVQIANELKRLSAQYGRAEIHLAYHGPYTVAVLIGRYLNTLRTVIYEWDDPEDIGPTYTAVLTLELGVAGGPIRHVLPYPTVS